MKEIEIPSPAYEPNSSFQDFVIDEKNNQVIIADTAGGSQAWQGVTNAQGQYRLVR